MREPSSSPRSSGLPSSPRPLLARLLAPPGPPATGLWQKAGATVMAVPGRYSVTYLLCGPDSIVVVDVGSRADIPGILDAIRWIDRPESDVRYAVPSHLHFDHIMGIDPLALHLGVPVALGRVAYRHVVGGERLRWPSPIFMLRAVPTWIMQGMPLPPRVDLRQVLDFGFPWARNQFKAELGPILDHRTDLPSIPGWEVLATPGHADDAISLHHAEAGFLVAGDTVRNFLGGEWNPLRCSYPDFDLSRRFLRTLHVETVFPAHGPVMEGPSILHNLPTPAPWMP